MKLISSLSTIIALLFASGLSAQSAINKLAPVSAQTTVATPSPEAIGVSSKKLGELNATIGSLVDRSELAGVVTLVVRNGQVAQLRSYGGMDCPATKPMRTDALFRIASMNKLLTAVTALTLFDEGRFQLDDPVSKFIPEFKNLRVSASNPPGGDRKLMQETVPAIREVTIRDLFCHTAGFRYVRGDTPLDRLYAEAGFTSWEKSAGEFTHRLAELPLAYQPGTKWDYSYANDVLGHLIEVLTSQPLDRAMRERLFSPLKMQDTGFFVPDEKLDRLTDDCAFKDGKLKIVETAATSPFRKPPVGLSGGGGWEGGFGGVVTTATDFGRCLQMIINRGELDGVRILRTETVDLMVSNQIAGIQDRGFKVSGYGLGVGVEPEEGNPAATRRIFWAGGPYNTCFWADLKQKMYGIFLTQTAPFGHRGIMNKFNRLSQACALETEPSEQQNNQGKKTRPPADLVAQTITPDLKDVPSGKGWKGATAALHLADTDGATALSFNEPGEHVVWIDGLEFTDGIIEFDAKGQSAPPQSNFIGVAFRVADAKTCDAVYFRPFNFRATDPERAAHAVQYVSEPEWTWQRLRKEKTGQFEKPVTPAPDGDAWFHAKIVIAKPTVSVFVNGAAEPSLVVNELSARKGGSVGLRFNGKGIIANLKITPKQ